MPAFRFTGPEPAPHAWGMANPGDIAMFAIRPPSTDWTEVLPELEPAEVEPEPEGDLKQPNKAASAEEWKAYAVAHGGFQEDTGRHPDDATRRAIVEHYTGKSDGEGDE